MTKFGWCAGPEGSVGDHGSCPYEIGTGGTIVRCSCPCHESAQNALGIRDMGDANRYPSDTNRGPDRANESDPLATDLRTQKGA